MSSEASNLISAGNLSNTIVNGVEIYQKGKDQLMDAIRQHDRAVMHITARAVARMSGPKTFLIVGMTVVREKQQDPDSFLEWLVGQPYWQTESQLSAFRRERSEGTLAWARDMSEFQLWRLSDLCDESQHRITWIKGPLGLGKSIIAAYFIDLLKCQYQNAVVAYFFCRKGQAGLTSARARHPPNAGLSMPREKRSSTKATRELEVQRVPNNPRNRHRVFIRKAIA
jgi:hypothetical protein